MALFFFFIDFAALTFEITATNLKVYSRPPEDHDSAALNGYFPCGSLVFHDLSFKRSTTALSVSRVKMKRILSTHAETTAHTAAVKTRREILRDVHKGAEYKRKRGLKSQTKTGGPEGFDYKCCKLFFFAITNKQGSVQRRSLIQSKTRHQLSSRAAFISI